MKDLHSKIYGTRTMGEGVITTTYFAEFSFPAAIKGLESWITEDPSVEQGSRQVEKALEELAQEVAGYTVKRCSEGIPEGSVNGDGKAIDWRDLGFLCAFSFTSPLPYERGFDSQGNTIVPFHLDKHWQDYFCSKYREAYLSLRARTGEEKPTEMRIAERPEEEVPAGPPAVEPLARE